MFSDKEILEAANESEDFDQRVAEILHRKHRWRWRWLTIWIVVFSLVVIVSYREAQDLVEQNKERISDIQKSRAESCRTNYDGTYKVIISLFPPAPVRTILQAERLSKLNETIKHLKLKCTKQVRTP